MRFLDIFMIGLLIITVSIVIGLQIVAVIDKKLGNVQVNMPPLPKPNIILNIKKTGFDEFNISVPENDVNISNNINHIESFTVNDTPANIKVTNNNIKNIDANSKNSDITNPDDRDVVDYGEYICYKKNNPNNTIKSNVKQPSEEIINKQVNEEINTNKNKCLNDSINKRFETGKEKLMPFNTCKHYTWEDIDPSDYYKSKYHAFPANMEDPKMLGYNDTNYITSAGIYEIGKIKLDDSIKYPKPNNYTFQ